MSIPLHRFSRALAGLFLTGLALAGCSGSESTPMASTAVMTATTDGANEPRQLGLCASCHGRTGIATAANAPDLAGRDRDELLAAMQAYMDGTRNYPPMRAMLGPISGGDRERLADWYASQAQPTGEGG